jgi:predicted ATPase
VRDDLPSGTVTFLFTDVEGSTRLLHELGDETYATALAEHRRVIRGACAVESGVEVDTQGDAFFVAFATARGALAAASAFTENLASGPISVRVGLHTGTPLLTDEGYVGPDVHRAARIASAGHGGQVLVSATTATLVSADGLRDLGEHRLKDLAAAERIYQLGELDFPPLKALYRTNLPVPATPFLGRERELAEVVELLTSGTRLLTLTGPGGTGKTRLALQAAAESSEFFPDGVFWVPLAPLRDPELVLPSLAQALAVSEEAGTRLEDRLVAHLSGKSLLVLLDNVEHLLPLAADRIATLRATNGSCLLVTSRERLRIGAEQAWPVPPLADDDGAQLFIARARAVDPAFTTTAAVDKLCARLDELPLAIELAAARTAVFSAEQLLKRISQRLDLFKGERDADPRQQTLRATIAWSYDLLSAEEQRLFARFAVFVGGCTYDAVEEVADADPDVLQSLLDKSLVRKRDSKVGPRYWMLETIREYAVERLEESGEAEELRRRHTEYVLAVADSLPRGVSVTREWLDAIELEHDNVRVALDRCLSARETQLALRLAGGVWRFWSVRGHHVEGYERVRATLEVDGSRTPARAFALTGATSLAVDRRAYDEAPRYAEEALSIYRELGDAWGVARATFMLGYAAIESGDFEGARPLFEDARARFTELGAEHDVLMTLFNLSWAYDELGDFERATELSEEYLRRARASGSERQVAFALDSLAGTLREQDRLDEAFTVGIEGLLIRREQGDIFHQLDRLSHLAATLALAGRLRVATRLLSSSMHLFEQLEVEVPLYLEKRNGKTLDLIHAGLPDSAFASAWREGSGLSLDDAVAIALGEAKPDA